MFEHLPDSERISLAKDKMDRVLGHFINLAALHENNAIVAFSPTLASQIRRSYAANAFNLFQHVMHDFELVRLCALWDPASADRVSIPTVVELVDKPQITDALVDEVRSHWANIGWHNVTDPELRAIEEAVIKEHELRFGEQQAAKARAELSESIAKAREIICSPRLKALKNHRDKHLAHSLTIKKLEAHDPLPPLTYGYTSELFETSIPIVEKLHCWVTGKGFSIAESRKISGRCAKALWEGCKFETKEFKTGSPPLLGPAALGVLKVSAPLPTSVVTKRSTGASIS